MYALRAVGALVGVDSDNAGVARPISYRVYWENATNAAGRIRVDTNGLAATTQTAEKLNSRTANPVATYATGVTSFGTNFLTFGIACFSHHGWIPNPRYNYQYVNGDSVIFYPEVATGNDNENLTVSESERYATRRSNRRSREPGFHHFLSVDGVHHHEKTGTGAFVINAPHFDNDVIWVEPSAWRNGSSQSDNWSINLFGNSIATQTVAPTGIVTGETFGVVAAPRALKQIGIISSEVLGVTHAVGKVSPTGLLSGERVGEQHVVLNVKPTGLASSEDVANAHAIRSLALKGIPPSEVFGVIHDLFTLKQVGIQSGERFGVAVVGVIIPTIFVHPTGIVSGEFFGDPHFPTTLKQIGIIGSESFGKETVAFRLAPSGIVSAERLGVAKEVRSVSPSGIISGESFGVLHQLLKLNPSGIVSAERLGRSGLLITVKPIGISSSEQFGLAHRLSLILVQPTGIITRESFGTTSFKLWKRVGSPIFITSRLTGPFYFEAIFRSNTGATVRAIILNLTDGKPISDSELSTVSTTLARIRSGAFVLLPSKEYQAAISPGDGTAGWKTCKLIILGE